MQQLSLRILLLQPLPFNTTNAKSRHRKPCQTRDNLRVTSQGAPRRPMYFSAELAAAVQRAADRWRPGPQHRLRETRPARAQRAGRTREHGATEGQRADSSGGGASAPWWRLNGAAGRGGSAPRNGSRAGRPRAGPGRQLSGVSGPSSVRNGTRTGQGRAAERATAAILRETGTR